MNFIIFLFLIKDAFVLCGMCVMFYLCKDMAMPFWSVLTIFATLTAQATTVLCELVILILSIIEDFTIYSLRTKKKKWVEEYERTHFGGIVSSDKSAIRELKSDDGLPINSGEAVIDEEKIRQFFNNK